MFERQALLNRNVMLNLISLENELLLEKERRQDMEEAFRVAHVFDTWPPPSDMESNKVSEILKDLILDRGSSGVEDLANELAQEDFTPEKKQLFRQLLINLGVAETQLDALKP